MRLLVKNGAHIEAKDGNGEMALSLAAANGHEREGRLLMEEGSDIEAKDGNGNGVIATGQGVAYPIRLRDAKFKTANLWHGSDANLCRPCRL